MSAAHDKQNNAVGEQMKLLNQEKIDLKCKLEEARR